MSTRLQVILPDEEMQAFQSAARAQRMTLSEWVRQALRKARREQPVYEAAKKIQVVREAVRNGYPSGDIDQINAEIEKGYLGRDQE